MAEEKWLPVRGYQGWYEVSDQGNVYALGRGRTPGGVLKPQLNSAGNQVVRLSKYGKVRTVTVASLVLMTFRWPPPKPGSRARHGAGGKLDDRLDNLTWMLPMIMAHYVCKSCEIEGSDPEISKGVVCCWLCGEEAVITCRIAVQQQT